MFPDLRSFLDRLEQEGQLVHYTDEVSPEPDIRAILRAAADLGPTGPAVMFHHIRGYGDRKLVAGVHVILGKRGALLLESARGQKAVHGEFPRERAYGKRLFGQHRFHVLLRIPGQISCAPDPPETGDMREHPWRVPTRSGAAG